LVIPDLQLRKNILLFLTIVCACLIGVPGAQSQIPANQSEDLADTLFVRQIVLCKSIRNREPANIVETFSLADKRGLCYVRFHNTKKSTRITFRWFYKDKPYANIRNRVGVSRNWRTYSSVRLRPGMWRVEVVDENGKMLEGIGFVVNENINQN
jgi:hypothetical protein